MVGFLEVGTISAQTRRVEGSYHLQEQDVHDNMSSMNSSEDGLRSASALREEEPMYQRGEDPVGKCTGFVFVNSLLAKSILLCSLRTDSLQILEE